jgi:cell division protein ZapA (FtsZ GTPase activity inhibitor)
VSANTKRKSKFALPYVSPWRDGELVRDGGKNRVTIKILDEEYIIRSSSPLEHMLKVGELANSLMKELSEKYPRMSLQKIAVLACLNLASDLLLLENKEGEKKKGG